MQAEEENTDMAKLLGSAVVAGDSDTVCYLLANRADPTQLYNDSQTLLDFLCNGKSCPSDMVQALLQARANPITPHYPLFGALKFKHYDVALQLIQAKVDVNTPHHEMNGVKGFKGLTLLHLATTRKSRRTCMEQIKILVEAKANVNVQDDYGDTPLHFFLQREIGFVNEDSADSVAEMIACLLRANADCNIPDKDGNTPLFRATRMASRMGHLGPPADPIISQLIHAKADPNMAHMTPLKYTSQGTPLKYACFNGRPRLALVELFLKSGAEIDFVPGVILETIAPSRPTDFDPNVAPPSNPIDDANEVVQCLERWRSYHALERWTESVHEKLPAPIREQTLAMTVAIHHLLHESPCSVVSLLTRAIHAHKRNLAFEL